MRSIHTTIARIRCELPVTDEEIAAVWAHLGKRKREEERSMNRFYITITSLCAVWLGVFLLWYFWPVR